MMTSAVEPIVPVGLLSLPQAARLLEAHYQTVYSMVVSGRLPAEMLGSRWVVRVVDVERLRHKSGT